MPIVKFVKEKKEIEVPDGANLRAEAVKAGVNTESGLERHRRVDQQILQLQHDELGPDRRDVRHVPRADHQGHGKHEQADAPRVAEVQDGARSTPDPIPSLAYVGHEDTMRLACCTTVHGDIEVETGPEVNLFGENFFS